LEYVEDFQGGLTKSPGQKTFLRWLVDNRINLFCLGGHAATGLYFLSIPIPIPIPIPMKHNRGLLQYPLDINLRIGAL
jgi:hypothetical protein